MIDAYLDLTWQFQVLVIEPVASLLCALVILDVYGGRRRTLGMTVFAIAWDVVVLLLFLSGGATTSWQHWLYAAWVIAGVGLAIAQRHRRIDHLGSGCSAFIGGAITTVIPLWLLLAGM